MLMWWRSAVNFSFFLCLAACRMRASACDTVPRLCARPVLCWLTFPSASALGSTGSVAVRSASFVGFPATMAESDSPRPCVIGYGSSPSRYGPDRQRAGGRTWGLPVPAQGACVHARFFDHAGSPKCLRWRPWTYCLPLHRQRRHPESVFYRGSMAGLHVPLPTLRRHPHGCLRTARGRCGSLLLHRSGLPPPTPCRSPGAPTVMLGTSRLNLKSKEPTSASWRCYHFASHHIDIVAARPPQRGRKCASIK